MFRNVIGLSDENPTKTENLPNYKLNLDKLRIIVSELHSVAGNPKIDTNGVSKPALTEIIIKRQASETIGTLLEVGYSCVVYMATAVEIIRLDEPEFYIWFKTAQKVTITGKVTPSVKVHAKDAKNEPVPGLTDGFKLSRCIG